MSGCKDCENLCAWRKTGEKYEVFCDAKDDWRKPVGDYDKCNDYIPKFYPEKYGDEE